MNENRKETPSTPPPVPIRNSHRHQNQQKQQNSHHISTINITPSTNTTNYQSVIPQSISQQQFQQVIQAAITTNSSNMSNSNSNSAANASPSLSTASSNHSRNQAVSSNTASNNAAKLAQRVVLTGSMQSLDAYSNVQNSALLSSAVAGKINNHNSSFEDLMNIKDQLSNTNLNNNQHEIIFETLNGEEYIDGDDVNSEIVYVSADKPFKGRLYVTNFRLYFKSDEANNYPIIDLPLGLINRIEKIGHQSSRQQNSYGIVISCKDGRRLKFANAQESRSRRQIFDTLQKYAFPLSNQLNVFAYSFKQIYTDNSGWNIYDTDVEYKRMGILDMQEWRFTDINKNYDLCDTYPKRLVVPKSVSDDDLREVAEFRSKNRIPVLSWIGRDKSNQAAIFRSSQPCCGIAGKQSKKDEEYLLTLNRINMSSVTDKLAILDARPQVNAIANRTKGGGYENEDNYDKCEVTFLNIANIHVMRESLRKVFDMASSTVDDKNFLINLENSKWLDYIKCILVGANKVVSKVYQGRSSVLVHCSDGWDRTSQLTSLSMLMLDKYYRTIRGFEVLIEKEWLSFGHRFSLRMGHGVDKHSDQDRSPIFVQFIDCVWQIQQQNKTVFEFNEDFLLTILKHIYTCQYGTFLYNCEYERERNEVKSKTVSLWSYINSNEIEFKNSAYTEYDGVITCSTTLRTLKLWTDYYFQYKETLNNYSNHDGSLNSQIVQSRSRKNFFTTMISQMKTSMLNLTPEPVLIRYKSSLPADKNNDH